MVPEPSDLGRALRAARESAGLSLDALAERLGVDRITIYRWEHGEREPRGLYRVAVRRWIDRQRASR